MFKIHSTPLISYIFFYRYHELLTLLIMANMVKNDSIMVQCCLRATYSFLLFTKLCMIILLVKLLKILLYLSVKEVQIFWRGFDWWNVVKNTLSERGNVTICNMGACAQKGLKISTCGACDHQSASPLACKGLGVF